MGEFLRRYWLFLAPLGALLLLVVALTIFFRYGGSRPPANVLQAYSEAATGPSPACQAKQRAALVAETPIRQQMQGINNQLTRYALDFSSEEPVGSTASLDDLAGKISPAYKQKVSDLEGQYSALSSQLMGVEEKACSL